MSIPENIDQSNIPKHIAIIMDGNGRWAKQRKQPRVFGHRNAIKSVRETVEGCAEIGVKYLTLYAFSTENWNRPKLEVRALMELLVHSINGEVKTLNKNDIRLQAIGDLDSLPTSTRRELDLAIEKTSTNKRMTLVLALSYSSKWEILQAINKIAKESKKGTLTKEIEEEDFSNYLTTANFPDPELMIRTSGEHRISNFLIWQLAYAELYFTDTLWPDFRKPDLHKAILNYQQRERRFGLTGEQITTKI
ncbi:MAG: isoprenyl transferase [Flavobacteriales bacterium]|nr:isoprenyl transferase [Flavobacteriales bacterium]